MEALAVEAFKGYTGPRDNKTMLTRFFQVAGQRISGRSPTSPDDPTESTRCSAPRTLRTVSVFRLR